MRIFCLLAGGISPLRGYLKNPIKILIAILSVYLALCAVLPAIIGWRRGLSRSQIAVISITGATLGWTGYGALLAWMLALLDDPPDQGIKFSVTVYCNAV